MPLSFESSAHKLSDPTSNGAFTNLKLLISRQRLRLLPIVLTLLLGCGLSVMGYNLVQKWEDERALGVIEKQAGAHVKALKQSIFVLTNNMNSIKKLYELSGEISQEVFHVFLNRGFDQQNGVKSIEWVERITEVDRLAKVGQIRQTGAFDFAIRDMAMTYSIADGREVYFPVLYSEPQEINGHMIGMDLYSSSTFKKAMDTAHDTGAVYASNAVAVNEGKPGRHKMRLFLPLYDPLTRELRAFVSGLIYIDDLVEGVLGDPELNNRYELSIVEKNPNQPARKIYSSKWRDAHAITGNNKYRSWTQEVTVAQKKWNLTFTRVDGPESRSYVAVIVLIFGGFITTALMWYLWNSHTHMNRVEALVSDRTQSLFAANSSLKKEIAERRKAEEKLFYSAYHDALTNCLNRRAFNENLHNRFQAARASQVWDFAVLFIDLDRLKYVNDTFGHKAGDAVIQETAERVQSQIRGGDLLARLGGDEFATILEGVDEIDKATDAAKRILSVLRKPYLINGEEFQTSGSVGVALAHDLYEHPEDLLRDSDTAMYHAKNSGRNQHAIFTDEMHERALRDIRLQTDLSDALQGKQFFLMYQPVYDTQSSQLTGMEALIRWEHPNVGLVPPDEFIALSEELGLIHEIGQWVMEQALHDLAFIHQQAEYAHLKMNINVSPLQVLRPAFFEALEQVLKKSGVNPSLCQIEITERALGTSIEEMAVYLQQLKDLGVNVLVDDFGTEHASLNHLNSFPVDGLKIDRSFITDMEKDDTKRSLVKTLIGLKDILDLRVTAEGIENEAQHDILRELNCDFIQGYLLGKPMRLEDLMAHIRE